MLVVVLSIDSINEADSTSREVSDEIENGNRIIGDDGNGWTFAR